MTSLRSFRVWCLSWDEEEDHGCDVVAYDIFGEYPREQRGVIHVPNTVLHDAADAAEAYADYVHANRDGCEATWPLAFRVRCSDGSTLDFEVDREYVPEFSAAPLLILQPATHVLWGGHVLCEDPRLHGVPRDWPPGQRWISLQDVAGDAQAPPDGCERCWKRAPGRVEGLRQIGASSEVSP